LKAGLVSHLHSPASEPSQTSALPQSPQQQGQSNSSEKDNAITAPYKHLTAQQKNVILM